RPAWSTGCAQGCAQRIGAAALERCCGDLRSSVNPRHLANSRRIEMAIVRYEPWAVVSRLHQSLDQFFNETLSSPEASSSPSVAWVPRVDVHEEKDRFVVLADVPGVDPKDIDITAENGVLTVRGERRSEKRETDNGY